MKKEWRVALLLPAKLTQTTYFWQAFLLRGEEGTEVVNIAKLRVNSRRQSTSDIQATQSRGHAYQNGRHIPIGIQLWACF